jgi:hypothetical protein
MGDDIVLLVTGSHLGGDVASSNNDKQLPITVLPQVPVPHCALRARYGCSTKSGGSQVLTLLSRDCLFRQPPFMLRARRPTVDGGGSTQVRPNGVGSATRPAGSPTANRGGSTQVRPNRVGFATRLVSLSPNPIHVAIRPRPRPSGGIGPPGAVVRHVSSSLPIRSIELRV